MSTVLHEKPLDAGAHVAPVAEDVADEAPGDAVVHTDLVVLAAAVAPPALRDAPKARSSGQVEEDEGVGSGQPDRQGAGVVALDDPPLAGDELLLLGGELVLVKRLPVAVVVDGVEVGQRGVEVLGEVAGDGRLAGAAAADDGDPFHVGSRYRRAAGWGGRPA